MDNDEMREWFEDIFTGADFRWGSEGVEVFVDWLRIEHMPEPVVEILSKVSGEDVRQMMGEEDG